MMSSTHNHSPSQEHHLRFFNDVVYESFPAVYNAMDWLTLGVWWRLVRQALNYIPPGGRVLEIGFGPGRLQTELARQADVCLGLDLAWGMCRFTQRRLRRAGLASRLVRGTVFALPYPSGTFDTAVSTFALSGVANGAAAVSEMARVTAVDGRVVLIDIGRPEDGNRLGTFWAELWERMGDFLYDQPQMMKMAGLEVTTFEEFGPGKHIRAIVGQKRGS
ncbi:MAG: methyltransferase domain-containing protein [Ardenticatenaceae bacterium]|nr:methyltransferase domain-containing protein [Ardenticatenaceae bacterium]